jgi:adenylate kinase
MKFVFLGPPGAGKGTIAKKAEEKYRFPHISTGDLFRKEIAEETDLGKKVQDILASGDLVPDNLTVELVKKRLAEPDTKNGFVFDGFPRTIAQAETLEKITPIDYAVNFGIPEEEVVKRLSGRRIAKKSGRIYHVVYNPPKQEGYCDETGEELIIRPDDREDAVRNRLQVYTRETAPLIDFYEKRGLLVSIDASLSPDEVFEEFEKSAGLVGG